MIDVVRLGESIRDDLERSTEVLHKISEAHFPWQDAGVENFIRVEVVAGAYVLSIDHFPFSPAVPRWYTVGTYKTVGACFDAAIKAWEPIYLKSIRENLERTTNTPQLDDMGIVPAGKAWDAVSQMARLRKAKK